MQGLSDKEQTKWLPVGHFEFYICKMCHVLSLWQSAILNYIFAKN